LYSIFIGNVDVLKVELDTSLTIPVAFDAVGAIGNALVAFEMTLSTRQTPRANSLGLRLVRGAILFAVMTARGSVLFAVITA
jgi:hypothetical protein